MTPAQDATALAPCPFCGCAPELVEANTGAKDVWLVRCTGCQCKTVNYYGKAQPQFIWNKRIAVRATSQTPDAVREALEQVGWLRDYDQEGEEITEVCTGDDPGAYAVYRLTPSASAGPRTGKTAMTEDQIKYMADRFLGWKLPENFNPDGGVSFDKYGNIGTEHQYKREPSGTNLFDSTQADAMVRYLIGGMPLSAGPQAGAVAWRVRSYLDQYEITTRREHADDWTAHGIDVEPLFTHPKPQQTDACPECEANGLCAVHAYAQRHPDQPQQADGRGATGINIEGIIGDCVSIDALPWKNDDGSPALLNRIIGIHEAANQIRAALQQSQQSQQADGRGAVIDALDNSQSLLAMIHQLNTNGSVSEHDWETEGLSDLITKQIKENRAALQQSPATDNAGG